MNPQCCICERENGEGGVKLTAIHTMECVVPICGLCYSLSTRYAFQKCRKCGAVATIAKTNVPGGNVLGGYTFIIFTEECKNCRG